MDTKEIMNRSIQTKENATALKVVDAESFQFADGLLGSIRKLRKEIEEIFKPIIDKQKAALEEARNTLSEHTLPLTDAETDLKNKMLHWKNEEMKRLREEQEERDRKIREQQAEAKLKKAVEAEERGDVKAAERILSTPPAPIPTIAPSIPKTSSFYSRDVWKFEIFDETLIPREYLMVDEVKIGKVVRAMKGAIQIPGVKQFKGETPAGR